jgi:hypothetical protein
MGLKLQRYSGIIAGIIILQHPLWSAILYRRRWSAAGLLRYRHGLHQPLPGFQGAGWGVCAGRAQHHLWPYLLANTLISTLSLPWVVAFLPHRRRGRHLEFVQSSRRPKA